ncbi:integrase core domain-containing protein [Aliiruegeria lutimaris]|uniref:integrase core domain-containing protein n=1 Tax=Aliiruegeria lutimaris TaxID=571298 RepID=UPI003CC7A28D
MASLAWTNPPGNQDTQRSSAAKVRVATPLRNGIGAWIRYYNTKRPHSSHGLLTPEEAYNTPTQNLKAAA